MIQLTDLVPLIQTITTMRSRTATIYMEYIYLKSLTTFSYGWREKKTPMHKEQKRVSE